MKRFLVARDIEALVAQGDRRLVLEDDMVLTDLAREAAARLGVSIVPRARLAQAPPTRAERTVSAAGVVAKPKACLHHGNGAIAQAATVEGIDRQVIDQLVSAVSRLGGQKRQDGA